jgi:hypothetical protein
MSQHTHKIVNGVRVDLTPEEIIELETPDPDFIPPFTPPTPTKEQLLAQLNALAAQIQALE